LARLPIVAVAGADFERPQPSKEAIAMLVLSRKIGERILIGEEISITVVRVGQGGVRLGIIAPDGLTVMREELCLPEVGERTSNPSREEASSR
jgi:carbon storage regulator